MLFRLFKYKRAKRKFIEFYNENFTYNFWNMCCNIKHYTDNLDFILGKFRSELERSFFFRDNSFDMCNMLVIEYNKELNEYTLYIKKLKKDLSKYLLLYKRNLLVDAQYDYLKYIDSVIDKFENFYCKKNFEYEIKKCRIQMKIESMEQDFVC